MVYEAGSIADNFSYQVKLPEISAKQYLAADLKSDFIFMESGKSAKASIASITKLVTAMVAAENINLDSKIKINVDDIVPTSKPRLIAGESLSAYQLLFPLLMESSNEAAEAFSGYLGNGLFVAYMNIKAKALGMNDTVFIDASGSGWGDVSTPEDLFSLLKNIYQNRSFILKISAGKVTDSAYGVPVFDNLEEFNGFSDDPDFVGGKVGENQGMQTMAAVFNIDFNGEKRPIGIIVLGSADSIKDAKAIKDYIKAIYGKSQDLNVAAQPAQ